MECAHKYVFESWGEVLAKSQEKKNVSDPYSQTPGRFDFFGTGSFGEALSLATSGWQEGAAKSKVISDTMFRHVSSLITRQDVIYDVEGMGFDVARVIEGEPECWMRTEDIQLDGPGHKIIKIVFNGTVASITSTSVITRKGAAIQALVELLEFARHRVELWLAGHARGDSGRYHQVWMLLKRASENADSARLAFALAHPSMLRRIQFAIWETMTPELCDEMGVRGGDYGRVGDVLEKERGDIYIGGSSFDGGHSFDDDVKAEKWVRDQIEKQGVHLKKEVKV